MFCDATFTNFFSLLANILVKQSHVKWGGSSAKLAKAVNNDDAKCAAINFEYSDSGLVGVAIDASAAAAGKAVETAAANLRNLSISAEEVNAAKNIITLEFSEMFNNPSTYALSLGYDAIFLKDLGTVNQDNIGQFISSISVGDVQVILNKQI